MIQNKRKTITLFFLVSTVVFAIFYANQTVPDKMTGIYWGAFDPPTEAHAAVITDSLKGIPLKKLMVVVNNHPYKNYTYSLEERLQMIKAIIQKNSLENVEVRWQDESHPLDFVALKEITQGPLCAIAGYDAYKKWVEHSNPAERSCYAAIAVVPRGNDVPALFDRIAFLLPIDSRYKDVSSTKVRASLCRKIIDVPVTSQQNAVFL